MPTATYGTLLSTGKATGTSTTGTTGTVNPLYTTGVSSVPAPAPVTVQVPVRATAQTEPSYFERLQALFTGRTPVSLTVSSPLQPVRGEIPVPTQVAPQRAPAGAPAPAPRPVLTPTTPPLRVAPGPLPPAAVALSINQVQAQLSSWVEGVRRLLAASRTPENAQRLAQLGAQASQILVTARQLIAQFGGTEITRLRDTVQVATGLLNQGKQKLELWRAQAQVDALQQQLMLQAGQASPAEVPGVPGVTSPGAVPVGPATASLVGQIQDQLNQGLVMLQQVPTEEVRSVISDLVVAGQDVISRGRPVDMAEQAWNEFATTVDNAGAVAAQAVVAAAPSFWQTVKPYAPWAVAGAAGLGILYFVLR